jgi:alkanesulfonate monooxygenase SsuD/methylene tetrahydromethanopterin reductase-like flavin-dependent oxidoreductase (luciferase family)
MDHFYQLPGIGAYDEPMFECYSMLSALAQHTERVRLSALVTGNTYRNPALLAKTITTLDHVSHGRATLGIGAGWFEKEHQDLGFEFGSFGDRFEKLEEALQIIRPMLRGERPSLEGKHYRVSEAANSPATVSRVPIMIGGAGEKKTLRMVAVAPTQEELDADFAAVAEAKGWNDAIVGAAKKALICGDPDTVGAILQDAVGKGLDGITVDLPVNGHNPERIALLAEISNKILR